MKKPLLALLLFPMLVWGQVADQPFKGSDLLIVQVVSPREPDLKKMAFLLQQQGFFINSYLPEIRSISASKIMTEPLNYVFNLQVYIPSDQPNQFRMFGYNQVSSEDGENHYPARMQEGLFNYLPKGGFKTMEKVARSYLGATVQYGKLPEE